MKKRILALLLCLVTVFSMLPVTAQAASKPKITKQPKDCVIAVGEKTTLSVKASGKGLKYRWYFKDPGGEKFLKSKYTTTSATFTMTEARDGRQIYCKVTDKYGNSVKSKTVTCQTTPDVQITVQPENCYVALGERVTAKVEATGKDLSYRWYFKDLTDTKYRKSANTTDSYAYTMTDGKDNRKMYCLITDAYGNSVKSNVITCKTPEAAAITAQPKSARASLGKKVNVSFSAKGDELTYQWFYCKPGSEEWILSSQTTATYSLKMTVARSGRSLYCVITDRYGNSVQTDTVKIHANGDFKSDSYSLKLNKTQNLSTELDFTTDDTFTWESSNPKVVSVSDEGVVKALKNGTATITATGVNTGIQAQCVIKSGTLKQVALTFDDGPGNGTNRFLDYLETTDAKVTFFLVGNRIKMNKSYTKAVKRMAQQGHEIGYHSYAHKSQPSLTTAKITSDFKKSNKILKEVTGQEFTLWRTPGGAYNDRVVNAVPLPHIMWSSSTADWKTRNADKVYNSILKLAKDGQIILLHDLHETTVTGAIRAMKKLEKEGYEFITVTELLSRDGTPPQPHKTYFKG